MIAFLTLLFDTLLDWNCKQADDTEDPTYWFNHGCKSLALCLEDELIYLPYEEYQGGPIEHTWASVEMFPSRDVKATR